jgi:hypothetical protein
MVLTDKLIKRWVDHVEIYSLKTFARDILPTATTHRLVNKDYDEWLKISLIAIKFGKQQWGLPVCQRYMECIKLIVDFYKPTIELFNFLEWLVETNPSLSEYEAIERTVHPKGYTGYTLKGPVMDSLPVAIESLKALSIKAMKVTDEGLESIMDWGQHSQITPQPQPINVDNPGSPSEGKG